MAAEAEKTYLRSVAEGDAAASAQETYAEARRAAARSEITCHVLTRGGVQRFSYRLFCQLG